MKLKNIEVRTFKTQRANGTNTKSPMTGHGFKDATYEFVPQEGDNYGIVGGEVKDENGDIKYLLVIDVDKKNSGMYDWELLKQYRFQDKDLDTYTVKTQSGGLHYYFLTDIVLEAPSTMIKNVDIKYVGGYVVGAGSKGDKGDYEIVNDTDIIYLSNDIWEFIKLQKKLNNNKASYEILEYELTDEDRETIVSRLADYRDWDECYNTRYSILCALKKAGFEYSDFADIIVGSPTDKTSKDWKTSWKSVQGEAEEVDLLTLFKYSKYVPEELQKTDRPKFKKHYEVTTLKEAIELSTKMFKDRYRKIRIAPKLYVLDLKHECEILKETFLGEYSNYSIKVLDDKKSYNPASLYYTYSDTLKGHCFDPNSNSKIIKRDEDLFYNGYNPIKHEPKENHDLEYCPLIMDYVLNVLASGREDVAHIIHTFVAKTIFNSTDRVNTFALAVKSIQEGTGKSFFGEFVYNLIGGEKYGAAKITKVSELNNENNVLKNKIFVYVDESANNWNKNDIDMMKDFITGNKFRIKQKYISNYEVPNYTHWYFNSNDVNIAPLGMYDRRYMVVKASATRLNDRKYFGSLLEEMNNTDAIEHYLGYVYKFKDEVVVLPDSEERNDQKLLNAGAEVNWLISMVEEESLEWNIYNNSEYSVINDTGAISNVGILYDLFQSFISKEYGSGRKVKSKRAFSAELKEYGFITDTRKTIRSGDRITTYYSILTRTQLYDKLSTMVDLIKPEEEAIQI